MTKTEAQTLREAANAAVRRYSRMTRTQLRTENQAAQEAAGVEHLHGGPVTKDELVADTLELRGYGIAKLNEATHVVGHDVVWPNCKWCQAAHPASNRALEAMSDEDVVNYIKAGRADV